MFICLIFPLCYFSSSSELRQGSGAAEQIAEPSGSLSQQPSVKQREVTGSCHQHCRKVGLSLSRFVSLCFSSSVSLSAVTYNNHWKVWWFSMTYMRQRWNDEYFNEIWSPWHGSGACTKKNLALYLVIITCIVAVHFIGPPLNAMSSFYIPSQIHMFQVSCVSYYRHTIMINESVAQRIGFQHWSSIPFPYAVLANE